MAEGPQRGLDLMKELAPASDLENYHLLHAARADMHRRLGMTTEAAEAYQKALALVTNDSERRYLERRVDVGARAPGNRKKKKPGHSKTGPFHKQNKASSKPIRDSVC